MRPDKPVTVLLILGWLLIEALIVPSHGDYSISIAQNSIFVELQTTFTENVTNAGLPAFQFILAGENASQASQVFGEALASLAPGIAVTDLVINASSASNSTKTIVRFRVDGSILREGDVFKADLGWKSFRLLTDIEAKGVSLNLVGERYVSLSAIWDAESSSLITWVFRADNTPLVRSAVREEVDRLVTFDLSRLSAPLSSWQGSVSLENDPVTNWTTFLMRNLTAQVTIREPTGPVTDTFFAGYSHRVRISASGLPSVNGDIIIIEASTSPSTLIMTLIAAGSILTGIVAFLGERMLMRGTRFPPRKKKR